MPRIPLARNVYAYRAQLRVLLFAGIAVLIAWSAFTSYSARLDKSSKQANPEGSRVLPTQPEGDTRANINKNYGSLPLSFEANRGQTDASVKFVARGPGYNIFLTAAEAVMVFKGTAVNESTEAVEDPEDGNSPHSQRGRPRSDTGEPADNAKARPTVLRIRLDGANINAGEVEGIEQLQGKVNYFIGNDSSKWLTDIATYRKVVYRDAYPGIDMVYYGNRQQLEYDLIVAPGADPGVIALNYEGASKTRVDRQGNLLLNTPAGEIRQLKPVVYQEINGKKQAIDGRYVVRGEDRVGFRVSRYDRSKPLVIDPILVYSSLVSSGSSGEAIAVDSNGYAYITGYAYEDFNPTAGAFQPVFSGDYCTFVTKINQSGTDVVYSTYVGGNGGAEAFGIAVDAAGSAYITGYASGTFPTTPGTFQPVRASDFDCFITKLNPTGSALVYSTFYGGSEYDEGNAIAVDAGGNAYVTGDSSSRNLVTTAGALQTTNGGGTDSFVLRLNSTGSSLGYASYLGAGGSDVPLSIAVDTASNVYVAGETSSFNFPQVNSLQGAGGVNRGLFRSTNNGASWSLSNSGLSTSQVYAIVINPITPAIMYAGTIGGVNKSVNGGATWVATGPITGSVRSLAIDPTNTSTVYAGTGNGVYKTTDGGGSWTAINNGIVFAIGNSNYPITVRSIAIDPSNPSTIYAGTNLGFYKTTNGGTNWTRIGTSTGLTSESPIAVVFDPATPSTIYAGFSSAGVFKSTNSGASWTAVNTGLTTSTSRSIRSLAIVPNAPATLYAGTTAGIFKTTNGGTSWSAVNNGLLVPYTDSVSRLPATVNAIVIDPLTPANVYAGSTNFSIPTGAYPLTSILKSTDGGANWTAITSGFSSLNNGVLSLAINLSDPSQLYAGNAGDFDGYAAKISANGSSFIYSTFVGSSRNDFTAGIVPDSTGNSYIYGSSSGTNLPITPGAFDSTLSGANDTFAMKLNAAGTARLYSTYLGGSGSEDSYGLAVDSAGNAYVVGWTTSTDFPVTSGAFQTTMGDRGLTGTSDAFVTKLNATGTALVYSSYLGGVASELFDFEGNNIALDPLGNAYVVGETDDRNTFPVLGYANAFSSSFGPSETFVSFGPSGTFVVKIDGNTASYSINGLVTTSTGAPIAGLIVEVKSTQGVSRTGITDAQGFYSIVSLAAGDYTVTPQKFGPTAHYLFTPASRTFNALSSDQTANFIGTQVYDIQGRVTSSTVPGLGIFDVTITLSGAASAATITDANGSFILRDLLPGNYTVTPSKTSFTFNPVNVSYTNLNANQTNANFSTPSATFFSVGGRVADAASAGITDVRIRMVATSQSGNRSLSLVTDAGGNYSFQNLQAGGNYTFTASKPLLSFTPPNQTFNNLSANQTLNFTAATLAIQATLNTWTFQGRTYGYVKLSYPNSGFRVPNWGNPVRAGNDFTVDAVVDVDTGGAQIQAVKTTAQIYDLGPLANGSYNFIFRNSGTVLQSIAFTISSAAPPPNPIDNAGEFVRQQYRDFLNREADPAGEVFWTDNITKCSDPARRPAGQTEAQCTLRQRETTSGAFFLSPEFQYTGYFVYRMYLGALGRKPKLSEFTPDAQFVGNGIVVNGQLSAAKINQNKADFAAQFANCTDPAKSRCAEFKAIYDATPNQEYVDQLFFTTGINASAADRAALVSQLNGGASRASVLQKVVDGINVISEGNQQFTTVYGQTFYNAQFNGAFVQLEYFGYMKRDPDDAGYFFWLSKLDQFGGNFVNAEMVLAFISSPEYRARFGQP